MKRIAIEDWPEGWPLYSERLSVRLYEMSRYEHNDFKYPFRAALKKALIDAVIELGIAFPTEDVLLAIVETIDKKGE